MLSSKVHLIVFIPEKRTGVLGIWEVGEGGLCQKNCIMYYVSCIMYHHVTFPHVHDQIIESLRTKFSLRISNQNLGEERGWKVWGGWFGCFFAILFTKCLPNVSLFLQAFRWDQTVIPQLTSINMALKCPEQIVNNSIWGNWATDHFSKQVVNWKMTNHNTTPSCFPTRASFFLSH